MITSKDNKLIKYIKSLSQKKYRDLNHEYIVEGVKIVREAIESNEKISTLIVCDEILENVVSKDDSILALLKETEEKIDVEYVSKAVFEAISDTMTPQGILAVIKEKECIDKFSNIVFALDDLQDPGNLGTIIRTLDAAGYKDLVLSNETAEPYNPKVVRSTMGAIFRLNLHRNMDIYKTLQSLSSKGYKIVVTSLDTDEFYYDLNFEEKLVIVIGNESKGVKKEIQDMANVKVKIPMIGQTESLNAAVATSIIAYEGVRQKFATQK